MKTIAEYIKPFIDEDFGTTSLRSIQEVLDSRAPAVSLREIAILDMSDILVKTWWL